LTLIILVKKADEITYLERHKFWVVEFCVEVPVKTAVGMNFREHLNGTGPLYSLRNCEL